MTVWQGIPSLSTPERAARYRAMGLWGDQALCEVFDGHAERTPDKLAIADNHVRWTYGQLQDLSSRLAHALLNLGVREGTVVAAQLPSCALLPLLHLATNRIGALMVPMATGWRRAELSALILSVRAPLLISVPKDRDFDLTSLHAQLREDLPELEAVRYFRDGPTGLEYLLADTPPLSSGQGKELRPSADAPGHVMVSSGTTGLPKASVWSNNDILAMLAHQTVESLQLTSDDLAVGVAPAGLGSTGYVFPVLTPLLIGASSVLLEDWDPQAAVDLIVREKATYATAVPTQMVMLLDLPLEEHDLRHLTRFNNAGAPLPVHVAQQIETRMGCRVQTIYGATDGGTPLMTAISDPDAGRLGSVGRVVAGEEVELRDGSGRPVTGGTPGEVCWRGANKSYGFLNQPEHDKEAFDDEGWFRSGDLGQFDADGYLRIVGRAKDMILRGGVNIFPAEVEDALSSHPRVRSVAVVAVPDDRLGERACAVVIPNGAPPELGELTDHLASFEMAKVKYPEFLVILEAMPTNQGGKIDRAQLREIAELRTRPAAAVPAAGTTRCSP